MKNKKKFKKDVYNLFNVVLLNQIAIVDMLSNISGYCCSTDILKDNERYRELVVENSTSAKEEIIDVVNAEYNE